MLVNVKIDISGIRELHFTVADFIGLVNFESLNEIGNIGIFVLWRLYKISGCVRITQKWLDGRSEVRSEVHSMQ